MIMSPAQSWAPVLLSSKTLIVRTSPDRLFLLPRMGDGESQLILACPDARVRVRARVHVHVHVHARVLRP